MRQMNCDRTSCQMCKCAYIDCVRVVVDEERNDHCMQHNAGHDLSSYALPVVYFAGEGVHEPAHHSGYGGHTSNNVVGEVRCMCMQYTSESIASTVIEKK